MSLCSYNEKNLVCANLYQMARGGKERGGTQTEAVIRAFKWQTHYTRHTDELTEGMSCQRPFWLSQAHTHSYVSQGSQRVLATETGNVRKQKGCLGDATGGNICDVCSTKKKKKPTMIDLKMGRVISKMEMDEKRRKRKGKSRAKTRRKSYFFSFKGHWDIGNLAPFI